MVRLVSEQLEGTASPLVGGSALPAGESCCTSREPTETFKGWDTHFTAASAAHSDLTLTLCQGPHLSEPHCSAALVSWV